MADKNVVTTPEKRDFPIEEPDSGGIVEDVPTPDVAPVAPPAPPEAPEPTSPPTQTPSPSGERGGEQFQIGVWHDIPNYGCPYCDFATLYGDVAVKEHIIGSHPTEDPEGPSHTEQETVNG